MSAPKKPPAELDRMADAVFAHAPPPKSRAAKNRERRAKRRKSRKVESTD